MNSVVSKKEERADVPYPLIVLERMRPCLANESSGVGDTVDSQKEGRRMSRRKKAKVFRFLNNIATVRPFRHGLR
jgi:hypothetical protein